MIEISDICIALERLAWLATSGRNGWLREHTPDVYVIPDRPSFVGGNQDCTDYGWFVWGDGGGGRLKILETTPVEVRRSERRYRTISAA